MNLAPILIYMSTLICLFFRIQTTADTERRNSTKTEMTAVRLRLRMRKVAEQIIRLGMVGSSGLMGWILLRCIAGTDPPFVVIYNNSMGPGLNQGDLVFLTAQKSPIQCGAIVVFKDLGGLHAPVIHRVMKVHKRQDTEEVNLLTKGDDNSEDDSDGTAYGGSRQNVQQHQDVIGRSAWYLPYAGYPIILVGMNPFVKFYPMVGAAGLLLMLVWIWKQSSL